MFRHVCVCYFVLTINGFYWNAYKVTVHGNPFSRSRVAAFGQTARLKLLATFLQRLVANAPRTEVYVFLKLD